MAKLGRSVLPTGCWGFPPAAAMLTSFAAEAHQNITPAVRTLGSPQAAWGGLQQESKKQPLPQQALLVVLLAQSCFSLLGISFPSVKSWARINPSALPAMAMVLIFISLFLSFFSH